jgi:sulfite exporter TauE/SafE
MLAEIGNPQVAVLCGTAFAIGVIHTILGPDHYVPFIAMARAGGWSTPRTLGVTAACGLGHVAGSVVIGLVGLALGIAVMQLEGLEAFRGDTAAWLLIGFGVGYFTWGMMRAFRSAGVGHSYVYQGADELARQCGAGHATPSASAWLPWALFLVFVFGPCEPLIPLLMYPAAKASPWAVASVVAAFTVATVGTMLTAVLVVRSGVSLVRLPRLDRFSHAFAGLAVLVCGMLVRYGL